MCAYKDARNKLKVDGNWWHINRKFLLTGKSRCPFSKHVRVEQFNSRVILCKTQEQAVGSLLSMGAGYHPQAPKPFPIVQ